MKWFQQNLIFHKYANDVLCKLNDLNLVTPKSYDVLEN